MVAGVLFDLDGTLLDIEIDAFIGRYLSELAAHVAQVTGGTIEPAAVQHAVMSGTKAMMGTHEGTNREVFNARVHELIGVDLAQRDMVDALDYFYGVVFPQLKGGMGPIAGGREAVETALALGLPIALATHPVFPVAAIEERMRWANVADLPFTVITTYETMGATKPHAAYFAQTAGLIGVEPAHCIMVGDDLDLDLPARATGMRVFHVDAAREGAAGDRADWAGDMYDFAALLPTLVG